MAEPILIRTPDGVMPVWVQGDGPVGMIVCMDVYGIRDELHGMCGEFAADGYTVFLPDLFHRAGGVSFPANQPPGRQARALNLATTWQATSGDIGCLLNQVSHPARHVAVGYCMGARHALALAALHPQRIAACALLHGGKLVTDDPLSPHRLIDRLEGPAYVAFARDDPTCLPEHQALLEERFAARGRGHVVERFEAAHGWMFPERDCHDPIVADKARTAMLRLFDSALREGS